MTDRSTSPSREQEGKGGFGDVSPRTGSMIAREPVGTIVGALLTSVLLALVPILGALSAGVFIGSGMALASGRSRRVGEAAIMTASVGLSLSAVVLGYPEIVPTWMKEIASQGGGPFASFPGATTKALAAQARLSTQWLEQQRMTICLGMIVILVLAVAATGSSRPWVIDQPRRKRHGRIRAYGPWVAAEVAAVSLYVGLMPATLFRIGGYLFPEGDLTGIAILLVLISLFSAAAAGAGFMVVLRARTEDIPSLATGQEESPPNPPRSSMRRFRHAGKGSISE